MKTETEILKNIRWRFIAVPIMFIIFGVMILWKVVEIQVNESEELIGEQKNRAKAKVVQPRRGDILDRKGRVLACSVPEYTIYFDARIAFFKKKGNLDLIDQNIDSIADGLARIFPDESRQNFYNLIRKAKKEKKIVKLYKNPIDYNQLQAVKKLPLLREGAYRGGLTVSVENNRVYPYGGSYTYHGILRKANSMEKPDWKKPTMLNCTEKFVRILRLLKWVMK